MDVTKVRFEAFKSLYEITCDLEHFTVITGPNGAGKSNFADALHFLGEVYANGLEIAVSRAGGYDNIAHRRTRRATRPISIQVEVLVTQDDLRDSPYIIRNSDRKLPKISLRFEHSFSFRTAGQAILSDFQVVHDRIRVMYEDYREIGTLSRAADGRVETKLHPGKIPKYVRELILPLGDSTYEEFFMARKLRSTALLSDDLYYLGIFGVVKALLSRTSVFQLSPSQCRTTGVPTPNAVLERYGDNLPAAADHLRRNDKESWSRVQEAMRSILPDLERIDIGYTEDRRLALQFHEKGLGRAWNAGEVSDGTIQTLALFLALFDKRSPLLVIEEPENSIHPWILRKFVDLCRDARKQILLTSHSPVLLNYVSAETVRLMSLSNGRSEISGLLSATPEIRELVLNGDISLFDAYDSGILPEAIPRGLTPGWSSDDERGDDT